MKPLTFVLVIGCAFVAGAWAAKGEWGWATANAIIVLWNASDLFDEAAP